MAEELSVDNLGTYLTDFMKKHGYSAREVASAMGCSEPTIKRLARKSMLPTEEMLKQTGIMLQLGLDKYSKLTRSEKERISESMGSTAGGVVGFSTISTALFGTGSAASITGGLAGMGAWVGGGMLAGIGVVAAIPLAGVAAGYGVVKASKWFLSEGALDDKVVNEKWERPHKTE